MWINNILPKQTGTTVVARQTLNINSIAVYHERFKSQQSFLLEKRGIPVGIDDDRSISGELYSVA